MNHVFACAILALALVPAQQDATLSQRNSGPIRWTEGAPNATVNVTNDAKIEGLKTDDLHIFVSLADIKETEYNRVWVQISNHGKAPIDFDPQSAILINEKDKTVKAEIPDKAAGSIEKFGEAKSQELASAHCNFLSTGDPKTGNMGNGCGANNTQVDMAHQVAAFSAKQAAWVRANGLKQKTVAPEEEVQGAIVFKKEKKAANYTLRIPVAGQIFEFPVSAQNKAPSYN